MAPASRPFSRHQISTNRDKLTHATTRSVRKVRGQSGRCGQSENGGIRRDGSGIKTLEGDEGTDTGCQSEREREGTRMKGTERERERMRMKGIERDRERARRGWEVMDGERGEGAWG